jgi:hypothetical protein
VQLRTLQSLWLIVNGFHAKAQWSKAAKDIFFVQLRTLQSLWLIVNGFHAKAQ